ncbi:ATP-dependent zinc metalloprotease FtsH [Desulfobulbus alkaliphilus]|uniref:ATP-dependent zinc metalloprotease FtsH n=1 Tax=Desulfobulbus alkaliphilus TaxID=869814 RepID=UPI001963B58C|nr:ATP-dependent zinc metalloprotease FtsH [Desulfobulbus alkaliphilus]MBM9536955.1 ATP-dependent zinc metalloprotease FtsH [Desulfobulbus alkaliphilus]
MNTFYKNLSMWLVIGLSMIMLFQLFSTPQQPTESITYSEFWSSVESGVINRVHIQGGEITGTAQDGRPFRTVAPNDAELIPMLRESRVDISVKKPDETPWYLTVFVSWFPMLLLIGVWIFFMRQMQMGGKGGALSFGKTRAKLQAEGEVKVTFKDVAGIDEAKEELEEIIDFLRDPQKFTNLGGRIPKGVLLAGPPGTGKTLLARAIAGEAGVPFFTISGSDFVEMFVGVGASRVRDLFGQGKKNAPCIIFIDEIDAVGRHRGAGLGGGHDEREQTLNQLLVEMDGFEGNEGVIIIAATNRPDVLDPALLRPGRFDRQVVVPVPDVKGRQMILEIYGKRTKLAADVDMAVIARGTPGFSGADLENLVNEAALMAARESKEEVTAVHLERAKDKVIMGTERKSMIISDREKEITAYHEAGHALVARLLPGTDPIHKVTIIPRGRALGVTMQLPVDERYTHARGYLLNTIAILFGGRIAEKLVFNEITTGAGNDIERASELARKMVCEWGMSDELGPLSYGKKEEQIFLGREIAQHRDYSEQTARNIDAAVKQIIFEATEKVTNLLQENMAILKAIASELLEKETIVLDDIDRIIAEHRGEPVVKSSSEETSRQETATETATEQVAEESAAETSEGTAEETEEEERVEKQPVAETTDEAVRSTSN